MAHEVDQVLSLCCLDYGELHTLRPMLMTLKLQHTIKAIIYPDFLYWAALFIVANRRAHLCFSIDIPTD